LLPAHQPSDATTRTHFLAVLQISASCAVIAAAVEAGVVAFHHEVLHQILWVSFDFWWMTPVSFLIFVVPAAAAGWLITAPVRSPLSSSTVFGILAGILTFSILLPYSVIAWWGSAALAVGVGVQAARLTALRDPARWMRPLTRIALVAGCMMFVFAAGTRVNRSVVESRSMSSLPAPQPRAPNVLFIVMDTVRAADVSVYGYERRTTPSLERLAADGTVFDFAVSTAPWTLPSHGSLFTGRSAKETGGSWRHPISAEPRALAESLRDRGYATGGFVGNLAYASYESGLSRGFAHYEDFLVRWGTLLPHASLSRIDFKSNLLLARSPGDAWRALLQSQITHTKSGGDVLFFHRVPAHGIATNFLNWQKTIQDRPFFAFLNFFDAHKPYDAPDEFIHRFGSPKSSKDRYDGAIALIDHEIGRILQALRDRNLLENTIVVVTSDHGELFDEHGIRGHGNNLYLPVLHVPLILRFPPAVPRGQRVSSVISLKDVAATVLELAGVQEAGVAGHSLAAHWLSDHEVPAEVAIAELERGINAAATNRNVRGDMYARFNRRFHYIRDGDGIEELYDYVADPEELHNLAGRSELKAVLAALREPPPQ
jgi:arylsulfatase A-like enzyme